MTVCKDRMSLVEGHREAGRRGCRLYGRHSSHVLYLAVRSALLSIAYPSMMTEKLVAL